MSIQEYTSVLLIAAILFAGILVASPFSVVAQEQQQQQQQQQPQNTTTTAITASAGNTTTSSAAPSSGIQLSPQPIYQERVPPGSVTPINQTHIAVTHTGNGTLTLPNSNQTINVISNGSAIASLATPTPSAIAKETIRAPNGETVTTTFYEIIQFSNPTETPLGGGKGLKIIIFHTNSTGMLAPLDGVIAAGINDLQPNGESELTAWRWESGIIPPLLSTNTNTPAEDSPPMEETPT